MPLPMWSMSSRVAEGAAEVVTQDNRKPAPSHAQANRSASTFMAAALPARLERFHVVTAVAIRHIRLLLGFPVCLRRNWMRFMALEAIRRYLSSVVRIRRIFIDPDVRIHRIAEFILPVLSLR